jgi:large subunit ribosomal protein L25
MSQETTKLQAKVRERVGSRYCRRIRDNGGLPAIVYGHGETPLAIALDAREANRHFHHGQKLFQLEMDGSGGGEPSYVLLKDLQFDHLGTNIVHCDFARVDLNERVETRVHLEFGGEAKGLSTAGAIMMHPMESIEIECLITNMPERLEVDVTEMKVGDIIHAKDVRLPIDTMVLLTDDDAIVAQIVVQAEQAEEGEGAEVSAGGAEPEVVGKKKEEESDED